MAGFDPVELIKPWTPPAPVIHVDSTPNTDQIYRADIELVGDIAAALTYLREHADARRELGQNGRRYVLQNYAWEMVTGRFLRALNRFGSQR